MMSWGGVEHRRNIFDAFLDLVKQEKDDDRPSIDKQPCDGICGGFSPAVSSSGSLSSLWIKPESDLTSEPQTLSKHIQSDEQHPNRTTPVSDLLAPCSVSSDPSITSSSCESSADTLSTGPSVLPALRISLVNNLPGLNSAQLTETSRSDCGLAPNISVSSSSVSTRNFSPTVSENLSPLCISVPTSSEHPEAIDAPSIPDEQSQSKATHFSFSFGCLDDLLPQNDPARSDYIHYKCARLRYPLPLAVAMAKLYSPSKIPSLSSPALGTTKDHGGKRSFRKSHQPDQGFLEIDDSHFTLNTPSTTTDVQDNSIESIPSRPLTKAQLRHARFRSETRNNAATVSPTTLSSSESSTSLVPVTSPATTTTTRFIIKPRKRKKPTLRECRRLPTIAICSDSEETSCDVIFNQDRHHSSSTSSPSLPPEKRSSTCHTNHVATELQPTIRLPKRSSSIRFHMSTTPDTSNPPRQLMTDSSKNEKPKSVELLAFWLLSSHHFTPACDEQPPHKIYLQVLHESRLSTSNFLMFGDVVRILCHLASASNQVLVEDLVAHSIATFRTVCPDYVYMKTPTGLVSLSPLRLGDHLQLAVIRCPSSSIFQHAFQTALKINGTADWRVCVSTEHMLRMCRFLSRRNPALKLLPELPLEKHQACFLISRFTRNLVVKLQPFVQSLVVLHSTTNQGASNEVDKSFPPELVRFLSPFWCRVLNSVLPDHQHIIGLGMLTRSFRMVYQHLFLSYSGSVMVPSSRMNVGPTPTLRDCLSMMHKHVSSCLAHLRDAYPSLVAAGSCLSARVHLAQMERSTDVIDPNRYRIELGRARLFDSVEAARTNVVRVLLEEIQPYLCQLIEICQLNLTWGMRLVTDSHLLGPYAEDSICEPATRLIKQSLKVLKEQCQLMFSNSSSPSSWSPNSPTAFCNIAVRMHDFLGTRLTPYIFSFRTALNGLTNGLRRSLHALCDTWIPAFQCTTGHADWRAATDVQALVAVLQNQFDLLELWLRSHHNRAAPELQVQMLSLQSLLTKTGLDKAGCTGQVAPAFCGLSVPYGSKNKPACQTEPDRMPTVDPLPDWPPALPKNHQLVIRYTPTADCDRQSVTASKSCQPESKTVPQTESTSVSFIPPTSTNVDKEPEKSSWVCVPSASRCGTRLMKITAVLNKTALNLPTSVVSDQVTESVGCPPTTVNTKDVPSAPTISSTAAAAKRVCVYLSDAKNHCVLPTEIITPRTTEPDANGCDQPSTRSTGSMDRRRLGRLKRRMKISHASCAKARLCLGNAADVANTFPTPLEVSSDNSDNELCPSKPSKKVAVTNQNVTSALQSDECLTIYSSSDDELGVHIESDKSTSCVSSNESVEQRNAAELQALPDNVCSISEKPYLDSSSNPSFVESYEHAGDSPLSDPSPEKVTTDSLKPPLVFETKDTSNEVSNHTPFPEDSPHIISISPVPTINCMIIDTESPTDQLPSIHASEMQSIRNNDTGADAELSVQTLTSDLSSPEPPSPGPLIVFVPEEDNLPADGATSSNDSCTPSHNSSVNSTHSITLSATKQNDVIQTVHTPNLVQLSAIEPLAIHGPNLEDDGSIGKTKDTDSSTLVINTRMRLSPTYSVQARYPALSTALHADSDVIRDYAPADKVTAEQTLTTLQCMESNSTLPHLSTETLSTPSEDCIPISDTKQKAMHSATPSNDPLTPDSGTQTHEQLFPSQACTPVQGESMPLPDLVESCSIRSDLTSTSNPEAQSSRMGFVLERVTAELSELVPWLDKCASNYSVPGPVTAAILGQSVPQPSGRGISIDLTTDD